MNNEDPTGEVLPKKEISTEALLKHAMQIIKERRTQYGNPARAFKTIAARWSLTLGTRVTPAQAALCLLDLKLARLAHSPTHLDSMADIIGYAAVLAEIAGGEA